MTNTKDPYKTPFERILEFGLHSYGFSLIDSESKNGDILMDEYIPVLISNTDYNKGQFKIIRERKIKKEVFTLIHLLAVQGLNSRTIPEEVHKNSGLYEILSLWLPPPNDFRDLPNFELSACVDSWYLDSLEIEKGKQKYEPRRMTGRVLNALQLHQGIDLPNHKMADLIEMD